MKSLDMPMNEPNAPTYVNEDEENSFYGESETLENPWINTKPFKR